MPVLAGNLFNLTTNCGRHAIGIARRRFDQFSVVFLRCAELRVDEMQMDWRDKMPGETRQAASRQPQTADRDRESVTESQSESVSPSLSQSLSPRLELSPSPSLG